MDIPAEQFLLLSFMLNYDIVGQKPISDINSLLDLIKNTELKCFIKHDLLQAEEQEPPKTAKG